MDTLKTGALILAGGRSSRMGRDKALMTFGSSTMLELSISFWKDAGIADEILVAAGSKEHFEKIPEGVTFVYDKYEGSGPMAGILAGFMSTSLDVLYVSAVDMPHLTHTAILPIPEDGDAAVYRNNGRSEPLFGVYKRSVTTAASRLLSEGNYRMQALLDAVDTRYFAVPSGMTRTFDNLNSPDDLMSLAQNAHIISVVGYSGSGKTTFLEKIIPLMKKRGLKTAVIKHDAHGFEMDKEGKDTWRYTRAGADTVGITGPGKWALTGIGERSLKQMCHMASDADIILTEGYKASDIPKIEIHRAGTGKPLYCTDDSLIAVVTDEPLNADVPSFSFEDYVKCADFICERLNLRSDQNVSQIAKKL